MCARPIEDSGHRLRACGWCPLPTNAGSPPPGGPGPGETGGLAVREYFDQLAGSDTGLDGAPCFDAEQVGMMVEKHLSQIGGQSKEALMLLREHIVVAHREPGLLPKFFDFVTGF